MNNFFRQTRPISRILFVFWVLTTLFGSQSNIDHAWAIFTWLLLVPVVLIELKSNKAWSYPEKLQNYPLSSLLVAWLGLGFSIIVIFNSSNSGNSEDATGSIRLMAGFIATLPFLIVSYICQVIFIYRRNRRIDIPDTEKSLFKPSGSVAFLFAFLTFCAVLLAIIEDGVNDSLIIGTVFLFITLIAIHKFNQGPKTVAEQKIQELDKAIKAYQHRQELEKRQLETELETPQSSTNFDSMNGHEFEHYCANLLSANGFKNVVVTPGSGDQGADILASINGVRYAIQCKCHSQPVGNASVQEALGGKVYYDCQIGVVLTNSTFTSGAKALAKKSGILLWDRNYLLKLIEKSLTANK